MVGKVRKDRAEILRDFYFNRFSANKAIAVKYIEVEFKDFFTKYPFNPKDIKDYDRVAMRKHILLDLTRILGDAGFRLYELLCDYIDDLYNRQECYQCACAALENLKLKDVN